MIDVLLTLLVIFMIINPHTSLGEKAVIPQPPPRHAQPQQNNRTVMLQLLPGPDGQPQLKINQPLISVGEPAEA